MNITIREYNKNDINQMSVIWNEVVADGMAFPQENFIEGEAAEDFFASQTFCGVAEDIDTNTNTILGLYILHPNNIGRCGHIGNCSYAVLKSSRGLHIGKKLVSHSITLAKKCGFTLIQFNAVVASNSNAIHLYESLGFNKLGRIPHGFRTKDCHFEDIYVYYFDLLNI